MDARRRADKFLEENGIDPAETRRNYNRVANDLQNGRLWMFAKDGSTYWVQKALNDGDDSYKLDTEQRTPLHMAAINGHVEVIQLFGATSKRRPPRKYLGICNQPNMMTPMGVAATHGQTDAVRWLAHLHAGGNQVCGPLTLPLNVRPDFINQQDTKTGGTALHYAACNGHAETVRMLLLLGASPSITDKSGKTAKASASTDAVKAAFNGKPSAAESNGYSIFRLQLTVFWTRLSMFGPHATHPNFWWQALVVMAVMAFMLFF